MSPRPGTGLRVISREDREFLPAALEVLEMPPSPVRMGLIVAICGLFTLALIWSYLARIDIIATAQGKIQPEGRVKIIQPLQTGKVAAIDVHNGQHVNAGDVLVQLDTSETAADRSDLASALASYEAECLRRKAAIAIVRSGHLVAQTIAFPETIPLLIRQREQAVLDADIAQLAATVASLKAQYDVKQAEHEGLEKAITAHKNLLDTQQQRVTLRQTLFDRALASKLNVIDAVEAKQLQLTSLAQQEGQLAQADASMTLAAADKKKAVEVYLSENSQKLSDAARQVDGIREKLAKAVSKLDNMRLVAPISGTVQGSILVNADQVVTVGEEVMRIVPDSGGVEIEAYLANKDISFVREGQDAIIKVEAFPFTQYGTVEATVVRVGRDSVPDPDARQTEEMPGKPMDRPLFSGGSQRMQNLVFPVTLKLRQSSVRANGTEQALSAGMAVSAEIHTGSRRIIDYLFSPLVEVTSTAMRER